MNDTPVQHTAELPRLVSPKIWRLRVVFEGKDRVRVLRRGETLVLGTSQEADLCLEDPTISGLHCRLEATAEGVRIHDLGSKNGVYVGGGRVSDVQLDGARGAIFLGRTTVEIEERRSPDQSMDLGLVGGSHAMARVRELICRFAALRAPVLVLGESGTGKDLVAQALHTESGRQGNYCPLNVAALPDSLLDAELFGHERGAFTGAVAGRTGLFEAASEGTLFLDEVAEMSPGGQAKLLRVVEDGRVRALGSNRARQVDVRLVSATCIPLQERVATGAFRNDLYHRLAPLVIQLPPLRQRSEDIPLLAAHFLEKIEPEVGRKALTPNAVELLKGAPWPGNVRELFGALYRAAALSEGDALSPGHLGLVSGRSLARPQLKAERAQELLDIHGSVSAAARAAGVPRTTFRSVLERKRAQLAPLRSGS